MTWRPVDVSNCEAVTPERQPALMLDWVEIKRLMIDDRYQRPLGPGNWKAIRKIADNFRWSRFQPVMAAPLEGGHFALIDGQHRAHAAAICGFDRIPAAIVPIDHAEQASAFTWLNSQQIRITPHIVFRAALLAEEPWAVRCAHIVEQSGCQLMTYQASASLKKPGQIYGIGFIRDMVAAGHADAVRVVLSGIRAFDTTGAVALYSDFLLRPFIRAVASDKAFLRVDIPAFLRAHNPWKLIDRADRLRLQGETLTRIDAFVHALRAFQMEAAA